MRSRSTDTSTEAIADPARLAIVRHLAEHDTATLDELAQAADVHLNTARTRVAALEHADVLRRTTESTGRRGRPRIRYELAEETHVAPAGFRGVAELLAAAVADAEPRAARLQRLGRTWGIAAGSARRGATRRRIARMLEELGFDAKVGSRRIQLSACPCPLASPDHPNVVCGLARGAVDGALEAAGDDRRVARPHHDPANRRCELELSR